MSDQEDFDLEAKIAASSLQFLAAKNPSERRRIWNEHKKLIASRSAAQVRKMEEEKNLC